MNVIGDSMSPALKNGNVVMINHFIYNIKDPSRGDIAAFQKRRRRAVFCKTDRRTPGRDGADQRRKTAYRTENR